MLVFPSKILVRRRKMTSMAQCKKVISPFSDYFDILVLLKIKFQPLSSDRKNIPLTFNKKKKKFMNTLLDCILNNTSVNANFLFALLKNFNKMEIRILCT